MTYKLFSTADELVNSINPFVLNSIYKQIFRQKDVFIDYKEYGSAAGMHDDFYTSIDSRLASVFQHSPFHPDNMPGSSYLKSEVKTVNNFGFKIPLLYYKNITLLVAKVDRFSGMPPCAKYKKELSRNNVFANEPKMLYVQGEIDDGTVSYLPNYLGIIGYYLGSDREIDGADIIVPDAQFKSSLFRKDLSEYSSYELEVIETVPARTTKPELKTKHKDVEKNEQEE